MTRAGIRHFAVVGFATFALSACQDGQSPFAGSGDAAPASIDATAGAATSATSVRLVDHDVEAPEVFQVTDKGLWDGRPSLGGVWVASAAAKDPERVIIRNTANGNFVIGALFRRERDNPGPSIQISSDAAAALGLIAGQPAEVNITALRRDEPAAVAPDATRPILDTPETVATETPAAAPLDTGAVAAAIDRADGTAAPADAAAAAPDAAVVAAEPAPKKRKWWQRNTQPDEVVPEATGAVVADTAAAGTITAAALPTPPAATATPAAPGKSLIQLGIFSVEENAQRAAKMVTKAGSPATVRKEESKGKAYWSVVAGPANTTADREALMTKVKGLGFTDAYFVSR